MFFFIIPLRLKTLSLTADTLRRLFLRIEKQIKGILFLTPSGMNNEQKIDQLFAY